MHQGHLVGNDSDLRPVRLFATQAGCIVLEDDDVLALDGFCCEAEIRRFGRCCRCHRQERGGCERVQAKLRLSIWNGHLKPPCGQKCVCVRRTHVVLRSALRQVIVPPCLDARTGLRDGGCTDWLFLRPLNVEQENGRNPA
ncbi:MAG TPA: hypothetical protein VK827_12390 [Lysobacter sp.]|nr:hypothetical protein [Lysobacter sp.]